MQDFYKDYATEDLVAQYQSTGDEKILEEIMGRNKGLIFTIARSYNNIPNYELDELMEKGMIACWRAAQRYSKSKGVMFSTFLKVCVRQSYNRIYQRETSVGRFTGTNPESYEELAEIQRVTPTYDDHSGIEIDEFVNTLTGTTKAVIMFLLDGYTNGDIAKALDVKPATVTYHFKRIQLAYSRYRGEAFA